MLQAALAEFGARGYAGARSAQIARRAGVNEQLIAYYFGGKAGLYRALFQRWQDTAAGLNALELPLQVIPARFFRASLAHRDWARLLAWQGLAEAHGDAPPTTPDEVDWLRDIVADLDRRRAAGELASDLDPACVLLVFIAAAGVSVLMPRLVRAASGLQPDADEFVERYAEQLTRIMRHLSQPVAP